MDYLKLREDQRIRRNLSTIKKETEWIKRVKANISDSNLKDIKWIGTSTITYLYEQGISDKNQLLNKTEKEVEELIENPLTKKHILNFIRQHQNIWTASEQ